MGEVFGYPIDDLSPAAERHRQNKLCPYGNKVPSCTKDKANDPLGVCSVVVDGLVSPVITCPVRFRQEWIIAEDAADFFFPSGSSWTSLTEVRLKDANGLAAGNIDLVLVAYDDRGQLTDFGSVEIQAVYISGNVRDPFRAFMADRERGTSFDWSGRALYPRPDFLSSSRKRLIPQLIFKGGIIQQWRRKQAVVLDSAFYNSLPTLDEVPREVADLAWLIYDLVKDPITGQFNLTRTKCVYTNFPVAMQQVSTTTAGPVSEFIGHLQEKLDEQLESISTDALTLLERKTHES